VRDDKLNEILKSYHDLSKTYEKQKEEIAFTTPTPMLYTAQKVQESRQESQLSLNEA